jgi:uncharacterized protein
MGAGLGFSAPSPHLLIVDLSTSSIILALVAASLLGALPPVIRRWSEKGLHLFIAVSAGIFLGTVFLHLLPELGGGAVEEGHGGHPSTLPWVAALAGFLGLFLLEKVWLRGNEERERVDPHTVIWVSAYIGLYLHAFVAGLGFSALEGKMLILMPILWHKLTESFSLTAVLRLAGVGSARSWLLVGLFSLATPIGYFLGREVLTAGFGGEGVLTGLACGTFLYVAACDLLPEVFHHLDRRMPRLVALLAGVAAVGLVPHEGHFEESFLFRFLEGSWETLTAMAPFLLFGFLFAGFLNQWLKPTWLSRLLSGENLRSVGIASVVGAPLPLCSCSVVPVAASLRRAGASKGATSAFLVATPETGVDSVSVTWGLLDPLMTVVRPLASILSALLTGLGVSWLVRSGRDDAPEAGLEAPEAEACCAATKRDSSGFLRRVLRFAFVEMFDDLSGALILGIFLSGLIAALLPDSLFAAPALAGSGGILLMLAIGIPVYVCASASTPIAAALILKGLSPGAALVFLLAGPATNLATLSVMTRYLGKRVVFVHVGVLALVTLALGFGVDALYALLEVAPSARVGVEHGGGRAWMGIGCAGGLIVLFAAAGGRRWRFGEGSNPEKKA